MRFDDQQEESKEVTAEVEKAKASTTWGRKKAQLDERPEKTREIEEAKKKGK
jgi:hypothetical protein